MFWYPELSLLTSGCSSFPRSRTFRFFPWLLCGARILRRCNQKTSANSKSLFVAIPLLSLCDSYEELSSFEENSSERSLMDLKGCQSPSLFPVTIMKIVLAI